jgi:hypothetical protein
MWLPHSRHARARCERFAKREAEVKDTPICRISRRDPLEMHKSWLSFLSSRQFFHELHVFCHEAFKTKSFSINAGCVMGELCQVPTSRWIGGLRKVLPLTGGGLHISWIELPIVWCGLQSSYGWLPLWLHHKIEIRDVSHCGLVIYIKKYLKAKEELFKLKCFTMQKYNPQKIL